MMIAVFNEIYFKKLTKYVKKIFRTILHADELKLDKLDLFVT